VLARLTNWWTAIRNGPPLSAVFRRHRALSFLFFHRMDKVFFTINFNDFMCPNARASHLAAAQRWGCDYVECTHRREPHLAPSFEKFGRVVSLRGYERYLYYDADCLISDQAPNPFDIYGYDEFVAVRDDSERFSQRYRDLARLVVRANWIEEMQVRFGKTCDPAVYLDRFFNGGFFLASEMHLGIFERLAQETRLLTANDFRKPGVCAEGIFGTYGWHEQAMFNWIVQSSSSVKLVLVPETWNIIFPDLDKPGMQAYVYHFTGLGFAPKRMMMLTWPWKKK